MIKIFKSDNSKNIFITGVTVPIPVDDFSYVRNGDLFSIDRVSGSGLEVSEVSYTKFIDDSDNGFVDANSFELYLIELSEVTEILDNTHRVTVSDHSDVNLLNSVVPKDGWVPKYVSGVLKLCMLEHAYYIGDPVINTIANIPLVINPFVWDFEFQRVGDYEITLSASLSADSTSSDIIGVLLFDGVTVANIANGEVVRKEGKDASGNNSDGRGTDQKEPIITKPYRVQVNSIGTKTVEFRHYGSFNGEASAWDVSIKVEEIFSPQIIT